MKYVDSFVQDQTSVKKYFNILILGNSRFHPKKIITLTPESTHWPYATHLSIFLGSICVRQAWSLPNWKSVNEAWIRFSQLNCRLLKSGFLWKEAIFAAKKCKKTFAQPPALAFFLASALLLHTLACRQTQFKFVWLNSSFCFTFFLFQADFLWRPRRLLVQTFRQKFDRANGLESQNFAQVWFVKWQINQYCCCLLFRSVVISGLSNHAKYFIRALWVYAFLGIPTKTIKLYVRPLLTSRS